MGDDCLPVPLEYVTDFFMCPLSPLVALDEMDGPRPIGRDAKQKFMVSLKTFISKHVFNIFHVTLLYLEIFISLSSSVIAGSRLSTGLAPSNGTAGLSPGTLFPGMSLVGIYRSREERKERTVFAV